MTSGLSGKSPCRMDRGRVTSSGVEKSLFAHRNGRVFSTRARTDAARNDAKKGRYDLRYSPLEWAYLPGDSGDRVWCGLVDHTAQMDIR